MRTRLTPPGISWPRIIGTLCGALSILVGAAALLGWAIHSGVLIQIVPSLAPMQRNTAFNFVLMGLALLGMVMCRPRLTFIGSAIPAGVAAASLLEYLFHADF